MRTSSTDSDFDDSEDSIRNSDASMTNLHFRDDDIPVTELSEEECARIRYNSLSDDCMMFSEDEYSLFSNLCTRSAN